MKKTITLWILGVLILILIVMRITYAFMKEKIENNEGKTNVSIEACAKVQLKDSNSRAIKIENTFPMADSKGLETKAYKFSVSSTCEEYVGFNLYLTTLTTNEIEDKNIHYALTDNEKNILTTNILANAIDETSSFTTEEIKEIDMGIKGTHEKIYKVYNDDIPLQGENDYQLYLWVDKDANNETMDQNFRVGVNIKSYNQDAKFIKDLSGKGNHGKAINIVKWDDEGITTSDANNIGYVVCGLEDYNFQNNVSLIVRVKINGFTDSIHQRIFNNYNVGDCGIGLAYGNNKNSYVSLWGINANGWKHDQGSKPLQENNWYTIVGTYDGNVEKLYINGELDNTLTFTDNIKVSQGPFYLGKSTMDSKDYTLSTFSDALIFDRALSDEEIKEDYASEINPTNKDNLLLWYKFS